MPWSPASQRWTDGLVAGQHRRLVLGQRPLDGGQDAEHLFLADLHRPPDALVRAAVRVARFDDLAAAEHQAARLRPAQPLAAAEDRHVRAKLAGVLPEGGDRRDLGGRVDQHRNAALVRDLDHVGQRQRAGRVVGAGEVEDAGRPRRDRGLELPALGRVGHPDLDQLSAGLAGSVVVAVAVGPVDDDLGGRPVEVGQAGNRGRSVPVMQAATAMAIPAAAPEQM